MLYEDNSGNLMPPEEVEALPAYEIEERGFHVYDGPKYAVV
jgi:hypothetical protein